MINRVVVVGGTHGNELTGVYLIKKWQKHPQEIHRSSFNCQTFMANPKAFEENRRYLDKDLNRCFSEEQLESSKLVAYEELRAKAINQQLGPKESANTDFIIDLHTTTSNMGPTLILTASGDFYHLLAAYISQVMPEVRICLSQEDASKGENYYLCSVAKLGVMVEVGPVPQGVLNDEVFELTQRLTHNLLDFVEHYNLKQLPSLPEKITAFRFIQSLKLPMTEEGELLGFVHENVQNKDFQPLKKGEPLFRRFDGTSIHYQGEREVYPMFINEAAYYDNKLAMSLMEKIELTIPSG